MKNTATADTPMPITKAKRLSTPRVKTGCSTCRTRRVKCDETRPACRKCLRTGRTCDGYAATINTSSAPQAAILQIASYSIPFRVPGSQQDRRLLHYFCVRGARDISGSTSSEFWSRFVLQVSQDDIVVRHALVALSSLHVSLVAADESRLEGPHEDALAQYGKALRSLQRRIEQASRQETDVIRTALICSVLFYSFESMLGNNLTAMSHLDKGLYLLAAQDFPQSHHQVGRDPWAVVTAMLSKLDMQATLYNYARVPLLHLVSETERREGFLPSLDIAFDGIYDAQSQLVKLQNWLFQLLQQRADSGWSDASVDDTFTKERDLLLQHFAAWERSLCLLMQTLVDMPGPSSDTMRCETQTLLIQHQVLQLFVTSRLMSSEETFGVVPNRVAHKILDLSESTLQLFGESAGSAASAPTQSRPSSFSCEMGVVAPLFLLAFKCTDNTVRQRASSLLASCGRREGLFDALRMTELLRQLEGLRLHRQGGMGLLEEEGTVGSSLEDWTADIFDAAADGVNQVGEYLAKTSLY